MFKKLLDYFKKDTAPNSGPKNLVFEEDMHYYKNASKNNTSYYLKNKNL